MSLISKLSFPGAHFKNGSQSPLASKILPYDSKRSQLSIFPPDPADPTSFHETWKTLPVSPSCETNRLYSAPVTYRDRSDNSSTIVVPVEVPFKRPPLTALNLPNNHLKSFPNEMLKLNSLSILNLSHNHLEAIPEAIAGLVNLESLDVSFNCLKSLPKTLNKLNRLTALYLESNSLCQMGDEVTGLISLKRLNIVHNAFENFPTSFCNLEFLTNFSFEWFSYTNPELDVHQRGTEGSEVISKLATECRKLQQKGKEYIGFKDFMSFFTEKNDGETPSESTLLHRACYNGDINVVKHLIEDSCPMLDQEDTENMTPLCISLLQNNTEIATILLQKGANFRKQCGYYGYPLIIAVKKGNTAIVKTLLDLGEDPNRKDSTMNTAIHHAVVMLTDGNTNATQMIQLLIDAGADPNLYNKDKWTPFHLAVRKKNAKAIQWLLNYNSEIKEVHGRDEVFNVNKRGGPYKWSPLHIAAYANLPELVEILAGAGADVFKRNSFGYTTKNGISKPGISLTLGQKYEKEMIKKHFDAVAKKAKIQESINMRKRMIEDDKVIRMASKNRFEENTHIRDSLLEEKFLSAKFEVAYPKKKVRSNPRWQSCQMERIGEEDFQEVPVQPTEQSHRGHQPSQSISIKAMNSNQSDVDENMTTDAHLYINSIPNFGNRARLIDRTKRVQKPEKSSEYLSKIDMSTYKLKLYKNLDFDYDFCKKELHVFKENLVSSDVPMIDKLKVFILMRRLHETMIDYLYRAYYIPVGKKRFAKYLCREILNNKRLDIGCKNEDISRPKIYQVVEFSNLLPEELIKAFKSVNGDRHEKTMLKVYVCRFLCELKNLVGLKFLIGVVKDPLECALVKREAQNSIEMLKVELLCTK